MLSNKVTFGVIALVGMVGAAGAGAWFASRGTAPAGKPAAAAVTTPPSTIPAVGGAVEATEAVMDDKESASAAGSTTATADKADTRTSRRTSPRPRSPDPGRGPPIGPSRRSRSRGAGASPAGAAISTPRTGRDAGTASGAIDGARPTRIR